MHKLLFLLLLLLLACCKKEADCGFHLSDYLGTYEVDEACPEPNGYNVTIIPGPTVSELQLYNFYQFFRAPVKATFECDTIRIPHQEPDGDNYFVEGVGVMIKNDTLTRIIFNYSIIDLNIQIIDKCDDTYFTKQ